MSTGRNQAASQVPKRRPPRASKARKPALSQFDPRPVAHQLRRCGFNAPLALVLGSGFQSLCERLPVLRQLEYSQIGGFLPTTVPGHAGRLLQSQLGPTPVLILSGRSHYYEGLSMEAVTFPVRVLAALGVRSLILTNAAGGIAPRFRAGDLMLLRDHINFMGVNPLRRGPDARPSFVDLSEVYDSRLRALMRRAAKTTGIALREGIYMAVAGPSYETPAEIRAFSRLKADAVGMSTVPEAVVARSEGLEVVGLSCITNRAAGLQRSPLSHQEVLSQAQDIAGAATELLLCFGRFYAEMR